MLAEDQTTTGDGDFQIKDNHGGVGNEDDDPSENTIGDPESPQNKGVR